MYRRACNVKAIPPLRTQIYDAKAGQMDREREEVEGGGDRSRNQGHECERGERDKIRGRVQVEYAQERDHSDEMGDLIKIGRIDIFQDRSMKGWVGGGRVLHPIRIKWCELTGGLEC